MELTGKRIAILTEDYYDEQEFIYCNLRLREAGATVTIVAPEAGHTYKSKVGLPATSDQAASQVSAADFDAVIIPGGYAPDRMRRDPAMVRLVCEAMEHDKVVAAVCHGPWILVTAGVLKGRTVTAFFSLQPELTYAGAEFVDREVVRGRNLITARNPADLGAFCRTIIAALSE